MDKNGLLTHNTSEFWTNAKKIEVSAASTEKKIAKKTSKKWIFFFQSQSWTNISFSAKQKLFKTFATHEMKQLEPLV